MPPLSLTPLKPQTQRFFFSIIPNSPFSTLTSLSPLSIKTLNFPRTPISLSISVSLNSFTPSTQADEDDDYVVGDCLIFDENAFEDPYLQFQSESQIPIEEQTEKPIRKKSKSKWKEIEQNNLVPEKWKEVQAEINITKKERRKIAQEIEFGSRIEKKKKTIPLTETEEFLTYRDAKMASQRRVVLDNPTFDSEEEVSEDEDELGRPSTTRSARVEPRIPRMAVYKNTLEDISKVFNSGYYEPGVENAEKNSEGRRKLFTKEEKALLNKRTPNLEAATSSFLAFVILNCLLWLICLGTISFLFILGRWLPLHTLAASGEFYLVDALLKYNVDINATDKDGLTAIHKAILSKKVAVTNYLLRESANPFVRDKEGATLMHYAVQTATVPTIKTLLLYNVDINLADNDGWTPLHIAVQTRRTDTVKLLLIKGADKTLKNRDGLTPLDLCLYSGRHARTYEIIKLLKQLPKSPRRLTGYQLT